VLRRAALRASLTVMRGTRQTQIKTGDGRCLARSGHSTQEFILI
jgi:hypothetical protein